MNLGTEKKFEAWVYRYGEWKLFSDAHDTAEEAFKHARLCGWDADKIEVVMVASERTRAAIAASKGGGND